MKILFSLTKDNLTEIQSKFKNISYIIGDKINEELTFIDNKNQYIKLKKIKTRDFIINLIDDGTDFIELKLYKTNVFKLDDTDKLNTYLLFSNGKINILIKSYKRLDKKVRDGMIDLNSVIRRMKVHKEVKKAKKSVKMPSYLNKPKKTKKKSDKKSIFDL